MIVGFNMIHYWAQNFTIVIYYCSKIKPMIRYETKKLFVIPDWTIKL